MRRKVVLTMMVTVAMAASVCTGCGNTMEEGSYEASVTAGQAAEEAGVMAKAAKMDVDKALADTKKMDTVVETAPEAVEPEEKLAAEEKKADTKAETKADTKADTKTAEKKAADTKAETKTDTKTAEAAPQESQTKTGGYTQFIGIHAIAGDTPAKTTDSQQAADTNAGTTANTQQETPAHQHVWKDAIGYNYEWIPNIVTVDDYETTTETIHTITCNCGAVLSEDEKMPHLQAHMANGEDTSYAEGDEVIEHKTKVGSHEEDQGHYERIPYVKAQYCDCGATK